MQYRASNCETRSPWAASAFEASGCKQLLDTFLDVFLPPSCLCCQAPILSSSSKIPLRLQKIICPACCLSVPIESKQSCRRCSIGKSGSAFAEDGGCEFCFLIPQAIDSLRALYVFEGRIEQQIKLYKYHGRHALRAYFSELLLSAIEYESATEPAWDLVLAIPSSSASLRQRGYGHMSLIASTVAKRSGSKSPLFALSSRRSRPTQVGLDEIERDENMRNAFACNPEHVRDKRILLLDDVLTSGATVFEAAKVLKNAGAQRVDVRCLAASPQLLVHLMNRRDARLEGSNYSYAY